jgi:hypothetical protein
MAPRELGSLTKEPPLKTLDATIEAISPGMTYDRLRQRARSDPRSHVDAPGLLRQRFLLLDKDGRIQYDEFLSLAEAEGLTSPRVRKVMYFVWAYRDARLRRFVTERIADRSGRWRATQILNKNNASFFEQWLAPSSAKKTRSNFEYFLVEAGILDLKDRFIHLELEDGWLTDAMRVAAQHEPDLRDQRSMTHAPAEFLIARGWHGLANATADDLRGLPPSPSVEVEPFEDDGISVSPARLSAGRKWKPYKPRAISGRMVTAMIDGVALERANAAHKKLEQILADAARARGCEPHRNDHVDVYFMTRAGMVLAEVKSSRARNLHAQVRRGISQLLEYHYLYRAMLGSKVTRLLVIETCPAPDKRWLVDYLDAFGITLAWKELRMDRLLTTSSIPSSLAGIVHPCG